MQKNKITILFVCPYPIGQAPSQRFRFEQYFTLLASHNFYFQTTSFLTADSWRILYQRGKTIQKIGALLSGLIRRMAVMIFVAPRFEFIFVHRESTPLGPPFFEWVLSKVFRKKIIYDFDDAIWLPNTSEENKMVSILKMHSKVGSICHWSYKVSGGNDYLCDHARQYNPRVILNPTTVDTEHLHNPNLYKPVHDAHTVKIIWTGSHSTLKYLTPLEPVLAALEKTVDTAIQFIVLADKPPALSLPFLKFVPWSKDSEIRELANADIGVMPLTDDPWANGKCGFKAIQYMALAIPALASPVGVNSKIIDHGVNGFLCSTPADWEKYLTLLIGDVVMRRRMGESGRKKIVEHYSLISNGPNFLSLFS